MKLRYKSTRQPMEGDIWWSWIQMVGGHAGHCEEGIAAERRDSSEHHYALGEIQVWVMR